MYDRKILWIDVSKNSLTIYNQLTTDIITIENSIEAMSSFIQEFESIFSNLSDWKVWIESTWDYSLLPVKEFSKNWFQVIFLNPVVTRKYIKWTIRWIKTDESDSVLIAKAVSNWEWRLVDHKSITPDFKKIAMRTEFKIKRISSDLKRYKDSLLKKKWSGVEDIDSIIFQIDKLIDDCKKTSENLLDIAIEKWQNKQEELIDSIPWFAQKLSCIVSSELWDISRFSNPKQLRAFAWLDPKISQSWNMLHTWRMTKHGNSNLRTALYLAAKVATKHEPHMKEIFETKRTQWKTYKHAINVVASKLCNVIYAVVIRWEPYKVPITIPET